MELSRLPKALDANGEYDGLEEQFHSEIKLIHLFVIKRQIKGEEFTTVSRMARQIYLFLATIVREDRIALKFFVYIFSVFIASKKKRKDDKNRTVEWNYPKTQQISLVDARGNFSRKN